MDKDVGENANNGKQKDKEIYHSMLVIKRCLGTCFRRILR